MGETEAVSAQQALLGLERSTLAPEEQLREAFNILNVKREDLLTNAFERDDSEDSQANSFVPKEEWVLRWLLKRIKSSLGKEAKYSTYENTWLLFNYVTSRISSKALGRLLKEADFLTLLDKSLAEIFVAFNIAEKWYHHLDRNKASIEQSSSTEVPENGRGSLKRKRKSTDGNLPAKRPDHAKAKSSGFQIIAQQVFAVLERCVALAETGHESGTNSSQHMRLALRGSAELVASLLSKILIIAKVLLGNSANSESGLSKSDQVVEEDVSESFRCLRNILNLWSLRSQPTTETASPASNGAFIKHLLVPSLAMVEGIQKQEGFTIYSSNIKAQVERLIALHVAQPLKLAVQKASSDLKSTASQNETTIKSILEFLQPAMQPNEALDQKSDTSASFSSFAPTLFDISIRSVPRNNLRKKQQENPWLQDLFFALSYLTGFPVVEVNDKSPVQKADVHILEELLDRAKRWEVRIDEKALVQAVLKYSGLESGKQVNWTLIARVIALDPLIFVNASDDNLKDSLLDMLLQRISTTNQGNWSSGVNDPIGTIIRPVLEALGRVRRLPSFIDLWKHQLISHFESKSEKSSLWTSEDFLEVFVKVSQGSLIRTTIESILNSAAESLEDSNSSPGRLCADISVADAILTSNGNECATFSSLLTQISKQLEKLLVAEPQDRQFIWWAYRLLHHIYTILSVTNNISSITEPTKELQKATQRLAVDSIRSDDYQDPEVAMVGYETFQFLAVAESVFGKVKKYDITKPLEALGKLISKLNLETDTTGLWDGHYSTMTRGVSLVHACLGVLLQYPQLLIDREDTKAELIKALIKAIGKSEPSSTPTHLALSNFCKAFLSDDHFAKQPSWCTRAWDILAETIKVDSAINPLVLSILLVFQFEAVPRRKKTEMADTVMEIIKQEKGEVNNELIFLLLKLTQSADSSSKLLSNPQELWAISEKCALSIDGSNGILTLLEEICKVVIERKLMSIDMKNSEEYLVGLVTVCSKYLEKKSIDYAGGRFHLCRVVTKEMVRVQDRLKNSTMAAVILELRKAMLETVLGDIKAMTKSKQVTLDSISAAKLSIMFDTLLICQDLTEDRKKLQKSLTRLEDLYTEKGSNSELLDKVQLELQNANLHLVSAKPDDSNLEESFKKVLDKFVSLVPSPGSANFDRSKLCDLAAEAKAIVADMPAASMPALLHKLQTLDSGDASVLSRLLLTSAIVSLPKPEKNDTYESALIYTLHGITKILTTCTHEAVFALASDTIIMIIQDRPEAVNQWNFDNILATISIATSPSGPQIPSSSARALILPRLCRVLTVLISRFRKKLGGRHHLLLPALQGLLTCTFTPPQPRIFPPPKDDFWLNRLPPWCSPDSPTLDPEQIQPLTRLLQIISDPSPSTVASRHRTASALLTDETAKARRIAGSFMQYLVSTYCHLQIQGGMMTPELKEALRPGIWTVLEGISIEGMRVMNAQMAGAGERSVWKEMYAEWKRVGKWKGD